MATMTVPAAEMSIPVAGVCDERFSRVRDVLAANVASGIDIGASAAVYIDGEPVVDIWGGFVDAARTKPWTGDTIVNNFSTTKTMTALHVDQRGIDIVSAAYDSLTSLNAE